jgi:hypothetical protein
MSVRQLAIADRLRKGIGRAGRIEPETRDESGAVLILALIFLVAVSLIVTALLTFVGTSLSATTAFNSERNLEYAATSTVNLAIQQTRYTFNASLLEASPPQPCWGSNGALSNLALNGFTINVWCSMTWSPFSGATRTVTYSACPAQVPGATTQPPDWANDATTCALSPLLQAQETFDDYAPNSPVTSQPENCSVIKTCGQTQNQLSWLWRPVVPVVSSVSGASGSSNGGAQFTINGTGFVQGSTVNLVWQTGPNAESWTFPPNATTPQPETDENGAGTIVQATSVQVNPLGTQITATAPAVTTGPYFFVTVTTPGGTSAYQYAPTQTYQVFTYTIAAPQIATIIGSGSVTGGALVTITGSGFFNAANFATQVWFVQNGVQAAAGNVAVNATGTSLTATSPAVSSPGTWNVQVQTIGGTSTQTAQFVMGVQAPIITSVSPSISAANPAQLTINGANFLSGSTVWFCLTTAANVSTCEASSSGAGQIAASATVASSGTSMTVSVPTTTMTAGNTYYPIVQLPTINGTTYPPSQPYNEANDIFTFT